MTNGLFDSYDDAMGFLLGRIDYERAAAEKMTARDFKLDRMAKLLSRLGNPQDTIPAVHITGTKGKGSTAVMVAEMLSAARYRTGLFTSPHVSDFEERMRVDGRMPSQTECIELLEEVAGEVMWLDTQGPEMRPTYFEIATAMAWLHFRRCRCDFVVLEVGLGGRLDSTNLCRPEVTVITNVSRDHMHLLGETVREIAGEKAGIIKTGVPLVCGAEDPDAISVIRNAAKRHDSEMFLWSRDFASTYRRSRSEPSAAVVDIQTPYSRFTDLPLTLLGAHQANNAAAAVTTVDVLRNRGFVISDEAVFAGMANVRWPLRLELLANDPVVIADAAHNEASAAALSRAIRSEFEADRRILIFAASRDKDVNSIAAELFPAFDEIVLTRFVSNPRSISPQELADRIGPCDHPRVQIADDPSEAYSVALSLAGREDLICAAGSFYLAAEIRSLVLGEPVRPPAATMSSAVH